MTGVITNSHGLVIQTPGSPERVTRTLYCDTIANPIVAPETMVRATAAQAQLTYIARRPSRTQDLQPLVPVRVMAEIAVCNEIISPPSKAHCILSPH